MDNCLADTGYSATLVIAIAIFVVVVPLVWWVFSKRRSASSYFGLLVFIVLGLSLFFSPRAFAEDKCEPPAAVNPAPIVFAITSPSIGASINDTTPTFSGTGEEGATITVTDENNNVLCTAIVSGGSWACTLTTPLADGPHTFIVTQTNTSGITTAAAASIIIDTVPPPAPAAAPDLLAGTDSGVSNTDNLTNDTTPDFTGACTVGETISLYSNGNLVGQQLCANGTFSITITAAQPDGPHTITTTTTDQAGNVSAASPALAITVDTIAPLVGSVPDMTAATDTGSSNSDNITANTQPTFTGTCVDGDDVALLIDGTVQAIQTCSGGSYSLTPSSLVADGGHTAATTMSDASGNSSPSSLALNFTVDTTSPTVVINQAGVAPFSLLSIGLLATQSDPTNINSATFTAVFSEAMDAASLTMGDFTLGGTATGSVTGLAQIDATTWDVTVTGMTSGDTVTLSLDAAKATDLAGNNNLASTSTDNNVTYDATSPAAPVITAPANGSTTSDNTPTITGTGEPNATVNLTIDGTPFSVPVDGAGNWIFTPPTSLTDGSHTVTATQTDAAGNSSPTSPVTAFTVDAIALAVTVDQKTGQIDPTATNSIFFTVVFSEPVNASTFALGDITLATSPSSPGAFIATFTQLNPTTWEFEVKGMANNTSISASIDAAKVQDLAGNNNLASTSTDNTVLYQVPPPNIDHQITNDPTPTITGQCQAGDNLQLDLSGPSSHTYTTICSGANTWSFNITDVLLDGVYDVVVIDTTVGGLTNVTANQTDALVVGTTVPDVTIEQKSGQADPTDINSASFTIVFTEAMDTSTFIAGDLAVSGTTGSVTSLVQINTTTWEATITGMTSGDTVIVTLPAGRVSTLAGNSNRASTSSDNQVTYDSTAPAAPVITSPANGSTTNDNTPTITGSGENGAGITLTVDGIAAGCAEDPVVVAGGVWTCTLSTPLVTGPHAIVATQTDAAGNASPQSAPVTTTLNTTLPTLAAPDMLAATDTGSSNTDDITSDTTPDFTGACTTGDTITLAIDGSPITPTQVCAGGVYTITPSSLLGDGVHNITAMATNGANSSSPSPALNFTIDTSAPSATTAPDMTAATDSGSSNSDNLTNDTTPDFTGSCTNGDIVTASIDGSPITPAQTCSGGAYTITPGTALVDGAHAITVTFTDLVGNISSQSPGLNFTIEPVAPSAPTIAAPLDSSATNDPTPAIIGTGEPNATIQLVIDGGAPVAVLVDAVGNWTFTPSSSLTDGSHTITATQTDSAGNVSPASPTTTFTVDTAAPTVTVDQKAGQIDPTATNSIFFTVTFSEAIDPSSFGSGDITLGTSPASPGSFINTFTQLSPTTWEFEVKGMDNGSTVTASLLAAVVKDAAGNDNLASTSIDNSVLYQVPPPNINHQITSNTTPALSGQCQAGDNLQLDVNGPATHTYNTTCSGGNTWNFTVPDVLPDGSYDIIVTDTTAGAVTNLPANQTDALVVDTTAPTVTVDQKAGQADPTTVDSASFTIVFSEAMDASTFASGDVTVAGTSGSVSALNQITSTTWEATITGMTSGDTVTLTLPVGGVNDLAGNSNTASTSTDNQVTYTTAPAPPAITSPTNGSTINDTTPAITGTGKNGATIAVTIDGSPITCAEAPVVVAGGAWTCTPSVALADGNHTITATQTDAGGTSTASNTVTVTVDTAPPAAPATPDMTAATDSGSSNTDNLTNDNTPDFTGSCTNGDTITLFIDGSPITPTQVCAGGAYTITPSSILADGAHVITATATNSSGNSSAQSPALIVTIDTAAPSTPVITSPANGSSTTDDTPTITGTGEPNASLQLVIDGGAPIIVLVDGSGNWSHTPASLTDGSHTLVATQTDAAGNNSPNATVTFSVDNTSPAVTINQNSGQIDPTSIDSAAFTVTFSEPIDAASLVVGDFNLSGTTGTITSFTQQSATTWEVTVTGMTSLDVAVLSLNAAQANDLAGNPNNASTSTDNSVTYRHFCEDEPTWTCVPVRAGVSYGTHTFDVPAQQHWVNSGLYLTAGQTATITESGSWTVDNTGDPYGPCTVGDMVARIDLTEVLDFSCVNGTVTVTAPRSGILYLGALTGTITGDFYGNRFSATGIKNVTITSTGQTVPTIRDTDAATYPFSSITSGMVEIWGQNTIMVVPSATAQTDAATIQAGSDRLDAIYGFHNQLRAEQPFNGERIRFIQDDNLPANVLFYASNPIRGVAKYFSGSDPDFRLTRAGEPNTWNWAFAHEMGHTFTVTDGFYQYMWWIESWPNIFSCHAMEQLGKIDYEGWQHECVDTVAGANQYNGGSWDAVMELTFLMQFKHQFGWNFYRQVYDRIDLDQTMPPQGTTEQTTWYYVHNTLEAAAGQDITPIFQAWGVPHPP